MHPDDWIRELLASPEAVAGITKDEVLVRHRRDDLVSLPLRDGRLISHRVRSSLTADDIPDLWDAHRSAQAEMDDQAKPLVPPGAKELAAITAQLERAARNDVEVGTPLYLRSKFGTCSYSIEIKLHEPGTPGHGTSHLTIRGEVDEDRRRLNAIASGMARNRPLAERITMPHEERFAVDDMLLRHLERKGIRRERLRILIDQVAASCSPVEAQDLGIQIHDQNGLLFAVIPLTDHISWKTGQISVRRSGELPQTVVSALPGMPLAEIVDHPDLRHYRYPIKSVHQNTGASQGTILEITVQAQWIRYGRALSFLPE